MHTISDQNLNAAEIRTSIKTQSECSIHISTNLISANSGNMRHVKSQSNLQRTATNSMELRRFSRLGSASQFESIDEDAEPLTKTDSGVQSLISRLSADNTITKAKDSFLPLNSSSVILERISHSHAATVPSGFNKRNLPKSISLLAGVFLFRIFDSSRRTLPENDENDTAGQPLMSFSISQPSFMITQNIYDSVVNFSIFNLSIFLPQIKAPTCDSDLYCAPSNKLFSEAIIDTMPGELASTGIPPALLTYKVHQTKLKMREIDIDLSKPLVINLSESYIEEMCKNLMIIYNSVRTTASSGSKCSQEPVNRKSKIMLMKANALNADRLNFKCNNIVLKLTNSDASECQMTLNDFKINLKFLTRPEKCSVKYSLAAVYVRTNRQIFVHPIALKGSVDFISELWNRLPLINVICKFNVIQVDLGISILKQLQQASLALATISSFVQTEWLRFQTLHLHRSNEDGVNRQRLRQMKYPTISSFIKTNKSLKREEFYQDDLRYVPKMNVFRKPS